LASSIAFWEDSLPDPLLGNNSNMFGWNRGGSPCGEIHGGCEAHHGWLDGHRQASRILRCTGLRLCLQQF
jgi:hypothetical protein